MQVTSALAGGGNRELQHPDVATVSSDYLRTMGIRVVAGRDFVPGDAVAQGVAIVDDSAARALWGPDDPVGQRISLGVLDSATTWLPVVGVARHVRSYGESFDFFAGAGPPAIYVVQPGLTRDRTFVLRTRPARVVDLTLTLRRFLRDAVPRGAFQQVRPTRDMYDRVIAAHAFLADTFAALALVALLICACGVYSVLSYAVAQRQRDFAVRIALGASRDTIVRTVIRDAAVMALAGTGIGAFLAMWSSQFVDPFLLDLYRIDALSLVIAESVLIAVALTAAAIPALRASRSNPVDIIRAI
jgi:hypothetical protein